MNKPPYMPMQPIFTPFLPEINQKYPVFTRFRYASPKKHNNHPFFEGYYKGIFENIGA